MGRAQELRSALKASEEALGNVVMRYRLALGCCCTCGDHFVLGEFAVAVVDEEGLIGFEHDQCPEDAEDYRSEYRNPRQLDVGGPSNK